MERELVGLLGAGLASVATGYGVAVPVGAIDRGFTLVDVLSRETGPRIGATLNAMVQTLWLEWQRTGLDRDTTAMHAGALPAIIELNRPLPEAFAIARNSAEAGRMLAAEVLERARRSGDILRAGLDEGIAYALLERLYLAIMTEQANLPEMMAAVDLYLRTNLWRQDLAPPPAQNAAPPPLPQPPAPAVAETAPVLVPRLSSRAINAIQAIVDGHGTKIADPKRQAQEQCNALIALIERVVALSPRAPDASNHLISAARHMAEGDLAEAERNLAAAQEALIQRASTDLSMARQLMTCASELLAIRAGLEEVRLDLRKAARHYRAATRCLTPADVIAMWQFLTLQAQSLLRLDQLSRDDTAFAEAVRVLGEATQLDIRQIGPAPFALAHKRLSELQIELGHRTGNAQAFLDAASHGDASVTLFREVGRFEEITDAQFARAQALWFAADRSGDLGIVDAAAGAFRDILGVVPRDQNPVRWFETSSFLGQALLRMATLRAEPRLLAAATEHLRAAVQFASTCNVAVDTVATEAALGRALLAEFAAGGQPMLLDLAATAFRRAIKGAGAKNQLETKGALQHELGMTLWAMAERAGQASGLTAAIEALQASIQTFESIKAANHVAVVRTDLAKLTDSVQSGGGGAKSTIQYT